MVPLFNQVLLHESCACDLNSVDHSLALLFEWSFLTKIGLPRFKILLEFVKLHLSCKRKSIGAFQPRLEAESCKLEWERSLKALYQLSTQGEVIFLDSLLWISRRKILNVPFQVQDEGNGEYHRRCMPMLLVQCARKKTMYYKEARRNNTFTN